MGRVRKAGSVITGRFLMADTDPDRAAQTLQAALEQLLLHSPEILLAALLALAYVLGFAEWAGTWLCDKVVTIR